MRVTTTYLEQTSAADIRSSRRVPEHPFEVVKSRHALPEFSRFLQRATGAELHWSHRLDWTWSQWMEYLSVDGRETWVLYVGGCPAGYAEIFGRPKDSGLEVEIESFGLIPSFLGKGLGGAFLEDLLRNCWNLADRWTELSPTSRVWLHTCSLDDPAALPNYLARGMREYDWSTDYRDTSRDDLEVWPGAERPRRIHLT